MRSHALAIHVFCLSQITADVFVMESYITLAKAHNAIEPVTVLDSQTSDHFSTLIPA